MQIRLAFVDCRHSSTSRPVEFGGQGEHIAQLWDDDRRKYPDMHGPHLVSCVMLHA